MIKKFLVTSLLVCATSLSVFAQVLGTPTSIAPATGGIFPLMSTGSKLKYVILTSPVAGTVTLFDTSSTNTPSTNGGVVFLGGTNVIVPAYTGYTNYMTNTVATNYVGTTGTTNYYTNYNGLWTSSITVPLSTNTLKPIATFAVGGNSMASYPMDAIAMRGVTLMLSTNISVTIYTQPE